MAFLVCYSERPEDHAGSKAAYLSQSFYEFIHSYCDSEKLGTTVLSGIADLKYKSPVLALSEKQLHELIVNLEELRHYDEHPEIELLEQAANQALLRKCLLTISGDMFPELD